MSSSSAANTIIASSIVRNCTILAHATMDEYQEHSIYIEELQRRLNSKKATPGWEWASLPLQWSQKCPLTLLGAKFHLFEHNPEEEGGFIIWSFSCVYDRNALESKYAESFIKHLMETSRHFRENDVVWKTGSYLAAQHQFSPTLHDMMSDTTAFARLDEIHKNIENLKDIMQKNIQMLMDREENIDDLLKTAEECNNAASVFKKRAKAIKKKLRRKQLMLQATKGLGYATVVSTAVVVPLVLVL